MVLRSHRGRDWPAPIGGHRHGQGHCLRASDSRIGINHIEGHLLAPFRERPIIPFFLALVVSGGHTHLYRVEGIGRYTTVGQTVDDAAGEAFDKVGKLLGLPYPGGIAIDRLAAEVIQKR